MSGSASPPVLAVTWSGERIGSETVVARRQRRAVRERSRDRTRALEEAHAALQRGRYADAIALFERVVRETPDDVRTRLKLADVYLRVGWHGQAAALLRQIATAHEAAGLHARAVSVCKQILAIEPEAADVCASLARLYRAQKLTREANRWVRLAAATWQRAGRPLERLRVLREHVSADPDAVIDRLRLAERFAEESRYDDAVELLREAWKRLESSPAREALGVVASRLLHFAPDDVSLKRRLAARAVEDEDGPRALALLRGCFRADPDDRTVLALLVRTFALLGQPLKGRPVLRRLVTLCDRSPDDAATCAEGCAVVCVRLPAREAGPPPEEPEDVADLAAMFAELDIDWSGLDAPPSPEDAIDSADDLVPIVFDFATA